MTRTGLIDGPLGLSRSSGSDAYAQGRECVTSADGLLLTGIASQAGGLSRRGARRPPNFDASASHLSVVVMIDPDVGRHRQDDSKGRHDDEVAGDRLGMQRGPIDDCLASSSSTARSPPRIGSRRFRGCLCR